MTKVFVRDIKPTSDPEMKCVMFEQDVDKPVTDVASLLSFANAGSSKFGPNTQKRIGFFNFSPDVIAVLGLQVGEEVPAELEAKLVVHEFCEGDIIPEEVRSYYKTKDGTPTHYTPPTWKVFEGTPNEAMKKKDPKMTPKIAGTVQQVLTKNGNPIYRETHFAIKEMIKDDITITHDNTIQGSNQQLRSSQTGVGSINVG